MIYSTEHANIGLTTVNLLEFTLANYEKLCDTKRSSQSDLDRHESAIDSALTRSGVNIKEYLAWAKAHLGAGGPKCPRIHILLRYCELGDSPTEAVHRYILVNRHKNKDAHRE
jgi:hypothetical protein